MSLPVLLEAVTNELAGLAEEMTAFVNRRTGELYTVLEEDAPLDDDDDAADAEPEDLADWQLEIRRKVREVVSGGDWVALPNKFDIHDWEIMRRFAERLDDPSISLRLLRAIHGRGAFRMFRATVEDHGLRDEWFAFRRQAIQDIAEAALDELGIPYR